MDVPVSKPVEAEYDEVIASSTDGLPFRKSLRRKEETRGHTEGGITFKSSNVRNCLFSASRGHLFYEMD